MARASATHLSLKNLGLEQNLDLVRHQLDDQKKAKDCQVYFLSIYLKKLGLEHVKVATSYNNLRIVH